MYNDHRPLTAVVSGLLSRKQGSASITAFPSQNDGDHPTQIFQLRGLLRIPAGNS
jgi:hypothetical protein